MLAVSVVGPLIRPLIRLGTEELLGLRLHDAFQDLLDGASDLLVNPVRHLVPVKLDLRGIIVLGHGPHLPMSVCLIHKQYRGGCGLLAKPEFTHRRLRYRSIRRYPGGSTKIS